MIAAAIFFVFSASALSQNKLEGYNVLVDVPTNHRVPTCTVRYVPPTTVITVTDLDTSTPMKLTSCEGSDSSFTQTSASSASLRASATNYKWCFRGEDERYRITMTIPGREPVTYDWFASKDERTRGFYNIRDFGARGDGRSDDTNAFRSAMAVLASNNGGTLTVPDGEYIITSPVPLPSGIIIQGSAGLNSFASTSDVARKNPTRITLRGSNKALFRIGECVENVVIRDIELYSESNEGTSGIEAIGAYTSSQGFIFERVVFHNFNRGINAYALPQTNLVWQFDYVKVIACRFVFNRETGIFINSRNTDWKIESSLFVSPPRGPRQRGDGIHIERAGMVTIMDTFGGGFPGKLGGTFINILDVGPMQIIGSQSESMTNSIVYNEVNNPDAGDYSFPIVMVNAVFDDPIIFKARRTFVSTGGLYGPRTFQFDERTRVYSTGDRFCYDGYTLGCRGGTKNNFGNATVIFMTGQPEERGVPGHPTFFGTDVEFGAAARMASFAANALPARKENGTVVYCTNCRRSTTPCQPGGTGAPAMMVAGQWSCL